MSALHPNLTHQLRQWAHRVGRAAVPDDATLRGEAGDTLMTEDTKPRTKGDELFAAGVDEIDHILVNFICAIGLAVLIASVIGGLL